MLTMQDVQGTYVEGVKEEVVLSPGHALSFIAAGEGTLDCLAILHLIATIIFRSMLLNQFDACRASACWF